VGFERLKDLGDDCTDTADLPRRASFAYCHPQQIQDEVRRKWRSYGFA
jgi:hypothetical protein